MWAIVFKTIIKSICTVAQNMMANEAQMLMFSYNSTLNYNVLQVIQTCGAAAPQVFNFNYLM